MERNFHHPRGMYQGRDARPWFTETDVPHEDRWACKPFPQRNHDCEEQCWFQHDPIPQWNHHNPGMSQVSQNFQCSPAPQWNQYHADWPSRDYSGFNNGNSNFQHRGGSSYRRFSRGRFRGKHKTHPTSFYNGPKSCSLTGKDSSHTSSRVLVEVQSKKEKDSEVKNDKSIMPKETSQAKEDSVALLENTDPPQQQSKKENDSKVIKDESAIPKETEQAKEDSVVSLENTEPLQVRQEANKAIISPAEFSFCLPLDSITCPVSRSVKAKDTELDHQKASKAILSPSQFSFRLSPDSVTCSLCKPKKTEDTEMIKLSTGSKTEDSHQVASCTQVATSELPATLDNLELKKEDKEIELKSTQTTDAEPSQVATLPSAKVPMEGEASSNTTGSLHPMVQEESMLATEAHRSLVASLASAKAPTGKQSPSETIKDSHLVKKEAQDTEAYSYQAACLVPDEAPAGKQAPSEVIETVHPVVKEEPVPVPETKQDINIASSIDPSSVTEISARVVEPPAPLETRETLLSMGREEDELMESRQPTDHFNLSDSPPAEEIPFLSDTTDGCQYKGKNDLELSQIEGSHEDADCRACDALAGSSSALPVIPSDVHLVPVLVRGKETGQPYFWVSEYSLHAQNFNWSYSGKGWAPEDYQEPSWGVDKTEKCGDLLEPERNLVLCHSSFHSRHSSDRNPDTGRVLECCSSSKSHHGSDVKHSSTQRTIKHLRSPLRQGWHLRSPVRQDRASSSDSSGSFGGGERTSTDYCCKCHCKCCQNPSRERFQARELPHSSSTHKVHCHHPSKENSKSSRTSRFCSPKNSTMKSQTRKKKSRLHEETKEKRSSVSVKKRKSSKITKKGGKALVAPINHEAALAVETSIPAETTEDLESANTEVQLTPRGEDTSFPYQPCAEKKAGTSTPSKIVEDPRSVAVLTRRNQIEQDYLQVILNFAFVTTMLLQKEPSTEQAMEVALRANMRQIGDYYASMLKNFIENYDLSETQ